MTHIDAYWQNGFAEVEGWLSQSLIYPLKAIGEFQDRSGIRGGMLEIGVHHGKLLIALSCLSAKDEVTVGIDLFDSQHLNIDYSGSGNYQRVLENIEAFSSPSTKFKLISKDSLSINSLDMINLIDEAGPFRIISIDGGHTAEHTYNDIMVAQNMLQSGGVVILDDYYNMHWPGVHEGVAHYFTKTCPKLKPFCYTQNKLFLADLSYHRHYLDFFSHSFSHENNFKPTVMWGSKAIAY